MYGSMNGIEGRRAEGMLNIVGFLVLIIITLVRMHSGYPPNTLLSAGTFLLLGYIFSLVMRFLRLPGITGFILAGVIAGDHGIGFVQKHFTETVAFIENIFIMLVLSLAVKNMFHNKNLNIIMKHVSAGVIISILIFVFTLGFIAPLSLTVTSKIVFGLFASLLCPLMIHAYMDKNTRVDYFLQTALGGFVFLVIVWGIAVSLKIPHNPDRIRMAFMPTVIGVTSTVAGFVWAYVFERLIYNPSRKLQSLYPLTVLLLIYPFIKTFGFDFIFLAAGIGLYNGLISERENSLIENSELPLLIIFILFGSKLPLDTIYTLGKTGWTLALVLTIFIMFARIISLIITSRFLSLPPVKPGEVFLFIPFGPLSIIILQRFLPGFSRVLTGDMNVDTVYTICMMSILLTMLLSLCLYIILHLIKSAKSGV